MITRHKFSAPHRRVTVCLLAIPLVLLTLISCADSPAGQTAPEARELVVFAAASLSAVFPEIGSRFESNSPGVQVRYNFAGSQRLRAQLEFGAKADVFASADDVQMALARNAGLLAGNSMPFATNMLTVVIPAGQAGRGASRTPRVKSLRDLAQDEVRIVISQPGVPAGKYARLVLQNLAVDSRTYGPEYGERVLDNVVSMETNVRAVVHKVALDEADAGFVYATDVSGAGVSDKVKTLPIPAEANVVTVYPAAVLKDCHHPELASAFVAFLRSEEVQALLNEYGFGPAPQ